MFKWFRRRDRDAEAARELQNHLHLEAEELREGGQSDRDAESAARRRLGNTTLIQEEIRIVWTSTIIEQFQRDAAYAIRTLLRAPAFTLAALGSLALGIGANTAIFSVVNALLIQPPPYKDPDQLVFVYDSFRQQGASQGPASVADFLDWKSRTGEIFQTLDAIANQSLTITGDGDAEQVPGKSVTGTFFQTLGVKPLLGNTFLPGDDAPGRPPIVLLSESLWRRRYSANTSITGKGITLNGRAYTVAGVMPTSFRFGTEVDIWTQFTPDPPTRRGPFFLIGMARLKPGVSVSQADARMRTIAQQVEREHSKDYTNLHFPVVEMREAIVGDVRPLLWVLLGAVALVLLIAVSNVTSLILARASTRRRELAIRLSTGAGRGHLIRQLLTESLLLALLGGALGVGLAYGAIEALRVLAPPGLLPLPEQIRIDMVVCAFTLLTSVFCAVLFGVGPALSASSKSLTDWLKEGGRTGESRATGGFRRVLVSVQMALSILLVAGAGLLVRSFWRLEGAGTGFDAPPEQVLTMRVSPNGPRYRPAVVPGGPPQPNRPLAAYWSQVHERLSALPGMDSVGLSISIPPDRANYFDGFEIEGKPFAPGAQPPAVPPVWANEGYLKSLGIRLLRGRWFDRRDNLDSPPVTVISDAMARKYFPGENPVGKRLRHGSQSQNPFMEIIGVVADVKYRGLHEDDAVVYYEATAQVPSRPLWLLVRSRGKDASLLAGDVRRELARIDANVPVDRVETMQTVLAQSVAVPRFRSTLMGTFAAVALLLAAMGVYGVIAYAAAQRRQEIGVRMALGATAAGVVRLVVGQGLTAVGAGIAFGLLGAFALSRFLERLLFGVSPRDPLSFAGAAFVLGAAAVAASLIPALRALRIDPVRALRQE